MQHSPNLIHSVFRSFLTAFFTIFGALLALVVLISLISLISNAETTPTQNFTPEIQPNKENVRKWLSRSSPVILQINIHGMIGMDPLTTETVKSLLVESREGTLKNDRVKGILLHINTPGGTVSDADGIYRLLGEYKKQYKVPVYAYVDGMCASGGMYIASAADKIFATSSSLVGNVGVLAPSFFNVSKLINTYGVEALTLSAGKGKDELNPTRPWVKGEEKWLQEIIDFYYDAFVDIVVKARPELTKEKLVQDIGAKTYPAPEAQTLGFVDNANANFSVALGELLHELSIDDDFYQVISLEKATWVNTLLNTQSPLFTGEIKHSLALSPELDPKFMNRFLYYYKP